MRQHLRWGSDPEHPADGAYIAEENPGAGHTAVTGVQEMSVTAVVTRCGCANTDLRDLHVAAGLPCPTPRRVEDLGKVAFYSKSPVKMMLWRAGRVMLALQRGLSR